jgi:hypothetical protein
VRGLSQCKTRDSQLSDEKFRSEPEFHSARPYGVASTPLKNGVDYGSSKNKTARRRKQNRA